MCLCRVWTFLWVTSPQNRMFVTAVTLNNKHLLPGNPNAQSGPARKQLATYAFFLSAFFFFSFLTGHFCDPAEVADEQLSMVTVLDIAMTTHFMGQKKRQQKRRKYNGINWSESGWQNKWNAATTFPAWKLMCVTQSKPETQWDHLVHVRLLNHSLRHTSCASDTPFSWWILQKNGRCCILQMWM